MPEHDAENCICDKCGRMHPKLYWDLDNVSILCIVCLGIDTFKHMRTKQKTRFLRELKKEV